MPASELSRESLVSLRDHLEARIDALQRLLETRLEALEKASVVASEAMEKRLSSMNEIRDALNDQGTRMATRSEMGLVVDPIREELATLRDFRTTVQAKASQSAVNLALAFSIVSVIGTLVGLVGGFL